MSKLQDVMIESYMQKINEATDIYMRILDKTRLHPLFSLTDLGEPNRTFRKHGLIGITEIPGTGHDYVCYDMKKNLYCLFNDDSEDISDKDKDLLRLLKRVAR